MLLKKFVATGILLLAGYLQAASLAWPFHFDVAALGIVQGQAVWWLQIFTLALLAWTLLRAASIQQAAWRAWLFSTAWMVGSVWWLYISMHTYGGLPAWLAAFAVLLLAGCLALFYTLLSMLFRHLAGINTAYTAIIFAACWLFAELARGTWLTGLPWGAVGYAHVDGPLAGLASTIGVYGLCFVAAYTAMLAVQMIGAWHQQTAITAPNFAVRMQGLAMAVMFLVLALYGGVDMDADGQPISTKDLNPPLTVALLQGNIPQNEKFIPGSGMATALAWYQEQLLNASSSLVVAPETAIPLRIAQLEPSYWKSITERYLQNAPNHQPEQLSQPKQQAALIGLVGSRSDGYTNAVVGLKPNPQANQSLLQSKPYQYDKVHLVPFGEFFPPFAQWFINLMNIPLGSFQRGNAMQAPFDWQGERLALNICYEDLFGEELAQRFANPAQAPTILVNVSNIAWFGNSIAIDQHLNIARMRSMELAKPSIRATNTGATVIIDDHGKVTQSLARHTRGVLMGQVQGNNRVTPYVWVVSRFWLWPWYGLSVLVLGLAWLRASRRD
ncbi:MAG TPA: apolipoprotein N-acyltransferase [Burkholderiaceae bacterium]|nr:apolipoprotein N-acyltransferase [Burkholderiaceae bacterium]